jgi:hypothetical protein
MDILCNGSYTKGISRFDLHVYHLLSFDALLEAYDRILILYIKMKYVFLFIYSIILACLQ